ncbi:MAG: septum site-determining protein MinD [Methanobacteriota archaeon]|nr:MAG: septum site-determining protein MinD [Euryarchaeota archaeon]
MTRYIVVASGKGGVGKTTLAANIAVALAKLGKNVAVLDADVVMANLEIIMGIRNPPVALIDTLSGRLSIEDVLYEGPEGVKVIPAGITLDGFNERNMDMLKSALREIPRDIDILVIDAPAGRDAAMVMDEGQEVLIVTLPTVSSVSDALKMKILGERMGAKIIGVIVNRVEGKPRELSLEDIENAIEAGVISIVEESEVVKEALAYETPFVTRFPKAKVSVEVFRLAASLIGRQIYVEEEGVLDRIKAWLTGLMRR